MSQATLLDGITVLDATQVMAGPYCAMLLADMGARGCESGAPPATRPAPWPERGNDSPAFNAVNRGKLGLVLDLTQPEAREVFINLARSADIVIENYRPGVMARLGLDYAALEPGEPRLISWSVSGPRTNRAMGSKGWIRSDCAGPVRLMSVTGTAGEALVKVGVPLTDLGAGLFAMIGILAALHHRMKTGWASMSTRRWLMPVSHYRYGRSPTTFPRARCPVRWGRPTA